MDQSHAQPPARALFITANRVGDAVLSTGILNRLIADHPGLRVTVACGPAAVGLFAGLPGLERLIAMPKAGLGRHWFHLWRQTVATPWDYVVDLRASALAWTLRARQRFIVRKAIAPLHRVRHFAQAMGYDPPPAPRLWTRPEDEERARALIPDGEFVIGVGPTANWPGKIWPSERYIDALAELTGPNGPWPGARIAVFGADYERPLAYPLLAAFGRRAIDALKLGDLLTVYAALGRCAFYIGNDSGLMHMAAAAGVPVLGLFGPSRDELYAPWGDKAAAVRGANYDAILARPGYDHLSGQCYMDDLETAAVVTAARDLWKRVGNHGGKL